MDNQFFTDPNLKFEVLNDGSTKERINSVIPYDFEGKDDFIRFYRMYDGVYFPDGAWISGHEMTDYGMEVEFIYRLEDIIKMREANSERSATAKMFVETHIPFARDAAGNEFYIEIPTGAIKYVNLEYDIEEGLSDAAPNFKEFCSAIKPMD